MIYSVSSQLYEEVQERLLDAIDYRQYFSGSIEFDFEGLVCRLTLSCFVRHRSEEQVEGTFTYIDDLIPVWWEFHTCDDEGEMLNDFSFEELRARL